MSAFYSDRTFAEAKLLIEREKKKCSPGHSLLAELVMFDIHIWCLLWDTGDATPLSPTKTDLESVQPVRLCRHLLHLLLSPVPETRAFLLLYPV